MEELAQRAVETPVETTEEVHGQVTETSGNASERPLALLGRPYLTDMFEMGDAYKHFEMEFLTDSINDFVLTELDRTKVPQTKENYQKMIDNYLGKLHLPDDIDIYAKVEKLHDLVKVNRKLVEAVEEKKRLMSMDITDMNSSQLRRYIEEKNESKSN
jgi:hypothetical protein